MFYNGFSGRYRTDPPLCMSVKFLLQLQYLQLSNQVAESDNAAQCQKNKIQELENILIAAGLCENSSMSSVSKCSPKLLVTSSNSSTKF